MRTNIPLILTGLSMLLWACAEARIMPIEDNDRRPAPTATGTGSGELETDTGSGELETGTGSGELETDTGSGELETDTGAGEPGTGTGEPNNDTDTDQLIPCKNILDCLSQGANIDCCDGQCVNPLTFYLTAARHCGRCSNDCIASKKGNSCLLGSCACGTNPGCVDADMCCKANILGPLFAVCGPC
jgi:hypothetical protein